MGSSLQFSTACSEKDIRDVCLEYLQKKGYFVWRDKQGTTNSKKGVMFPESRGCPDIIGLTKQGRLMGIEIKKPGGKLSIEQHSFLERIKESGGIAIIATCLQDVRDKGL